MKLVDTYIVDADNPYGSQYAVRSVETNGYIGTWMQMYEYDARWKYSGIPYAGWTGFVVSSVPILSCGGFRMLREEDWQRQLQRQKYGNKKVNTLCNL
jgi:hypothetical protein